MSQSVYDMMEAARNKVVELAWMLQEFAVCENWEQFQEVRDRLMMDIAIERIIINTNMVGDKDYRDYVQ